jgi:hypothetical protein
MGKKIFRISAAQIHLRRWDVPGYYDLSVSLPWDLVGAKVHPRFMRYVAGALEPYGATIVDNTLNQPEGTHGPATLTMTLQMPEPKYHSVLVSDLADAVNEAMK